VDLVQLAPLPVHSKTGKPMTTYLCPILQDSQFTDNGNFLASGLIWFYEAGSTTPLAAYTTQSGVSTWPNPIVLNARGETGGTIWLAAGQAYKIVLESPPEYGDTHGVVISTFDNVQGVNDPASPTGGTAQNWYTFAGSPVFVSGTQFTLAGDQTSTFQVNRRIRTQNSGGVRYSTITASVYTTLTTVTVANDAGVLDVGLNSVDYGLIEVGSTPSIPINQRLFTTSSPTFASATIPTLLGAVSAPGGITGNLAGTASATSQTNFAALTLVGSQVWANSNNPASLGAPGYANLANGLQIRWGSATFNTTSATTSFALAFSNACQSVTVSTQSSGTPTDAKVVSGNNVTASSFDAGLTRVTAGGAGTQTGFYIAIGY
jgi:hypothetical protein